MEAEIIGEDDVDIGTKVIDNNGAEHHIEMHKTDGEIYAHHCEAYHDKPAKRSDEENEYNNQARRYAQYYVFLEEGYDTVRPKHLHPVRVNLARYAIEQMDLDEFEDHFGDIYRQLLSHYDDDAEREIHTPEESENERFHIYRKEVYLGLDPLDSDFAEEATQLAERYGFDIETDTAKDTPLASLSADAIDAWTAFSKDLVEDMDEGDAVDLAEGVYVDTVSELYMSYIDHDGRQQMTTATAPDIEPHAVIQQPVANPDSLEQFKRAIEWNLICQVRDYFIRMGVMPPDEYQVLGTGTYDALKAYEWVDFYPDYVMPEEDGALFGDLDPKYFGEDSMLGSVRSLLG